MLTGGRKIKYDEVMAMCKKVREGVEDREGVLNKLNDLLDYILKDERDSNNLWHYTNISPDKNNTRRECPRCGRMCHEMASDKYGYVVGCEFCVDFSPAEDYDEEWW